MGRYVGVMVGRGGMVVKNVVKNVVEKRRNDLSDYLSERADYF